MKKTIENNPEEQPVVDEEKKGETSSEDETLGMDINDIVGERFRIAKDMRQTSGE